MQLNDLQGGPKYVNSP